MASAPVARATALALLEAGQWACSKKPSGRRRQEVGPPPGDVPSVGRHVASEWTRRGRPSSELGVRPKADSRVLLRGKVVAMPGARGQKFTYEGFDVDPA